MKIITIQFRKVILLIVATCVIALIIFGALSFFIVNHIQSSQCNRLVAIINDKEKMKYIQDWVETNTKDEKIMSLFNRSGFLSARDDSENFTKLAIDWAFLGINSKHASVYIEKKQNRNNEKLSLENIEYIKFIDGRDTGLVVVLGGIKELSLPDREKKYQIASSEKNIYLDCDMR